ncbi:putative reverse transcriptase domain-containing protein [Tanacetum coccineum]|uniref:Reverse transcriptase domain-containing protein n=1 Tax=Tanacetum coccineum TaxID=301880 RepID=A0ABQ5BLZ3_9ASTR
MVLFGSFFMILQNQKFQHEDLLHDQHGGFTLAALDSLYSKGLRTVISIPPKCHLGFSRVLKGALDKTFLPRNNLECKSAIKRQRQEESIVNAIQSWGTPGGSLQLLKETLAESSPNFLDVDEDDLDLGDRNIKQCKRKICDGHYTAAVRVLSSSGVAPYNEATLEDLKTKHPFYPAPSLPHISTDHHHLIASSTVVLDRIKSFPRGTSCGRDGLCAQHLMDCLSGGAVAVSDELISFITQVVNLFLAGTVPKSVCTIWRRLVSKVSTIMIGHSLDGYLDGLQFGAGVAGGSEAILHSVNHLIEASGDDVGLSMLLVDFKNAFNLVDREVMFHEVCLRCPAISRWVDFVYYNPAKLYYGEHTLWSCQGVQQGDPLGPLLFFLVLHPLICKIRDSFSLSLHAWYLDDGTIIGDTVIVGKILELIMEDGPRCGLQLNVDKTKVFWPKEDPRSRLTVAKTIGLMDAIAKINDPQCDLLLLRSCTGIFRLYFIMRTCPPRFFESAQHSFDVALRSSLERIVTALKSGFGDWQWRLAALPLALEWAWCLFCGECFTKLWLSCIRLQSKRTSTNTFDILIALWTSQSEDHTSDWLRTFPISGLGKTMNACSRVFAGDIYGDHVVSCAAGNEVDNGLDRGRDKPLRPADMLLYSWDKGLDVCVDVTGSSPSTQTGLVDFITRPTPTIRGRCGYLAKADPEVLHNSGYWGTRGYSYFLIGLVLQLLLKW